MLPVQCGLLAQGLLPAVTCEALPNSKGSGKCEGTRALPCTVDVTAQVRKQP